MSNVFEHPPTETQKAIQKAFDDGVIQGRNEERRSLLSWLEAKYIKDPKRPERGTPEGDAILQVARDAMQHFKEKR